MRLLQKRALLRDLLIRGVNEPFRMVRIAEHNSPLRRLVPRNPLLGEARIAQPQREILYNTNHPESLEYARIREKSRSRARFCSNR